MQSMIRKWGNSAGAIIPSRVLAQAGMHMGDAVSIHAQPGEIIIRTAEPEYTLEQLLAATPAKSQRSVEDHQWLQGSTVGKELL